MPFLRPHSQWIRSAFNLKTLVLGAGRWLSLTLTVNQASRRRLLVLVTGGWVHPIPRLHCSCSAHGSICSLLLLTRCSLQSSVPFPRLWTLLLVVSRWAGWQLLGRSLHLWLCTAVLTLQLLAHAQTPTCLAVRPAAVLMQARL